jgi:hypothetical protein
MKRSALKYGILSVTAAIITFVLLIIPFHAFISVWLASNFGHYTAFRLWKEALLGIATLGALYLVLFDKKTRLRTLYHELTWLIVAYFTVQFLWAAWAIAHDNVTTKAAAYGVLVDLRFILFFLCAWVIGSRTVRLSANWSKVLVWPAMVVIAVGLLQAFVLPTDFMRHFGYSDATIPPYETINHNTMYIRIMSTLRGANPLGEYLLLPISGLLVLMTVGKRNWRRSLALGGGIVVLFFSFSRAAWIGLVLSALTVAALRLNKSQLRYVGFGSAGLVLVTAVVSAVFWNNTHFQNFVFHTQDNSAVAVSSNDGHVSAFSGGLKDAIHEPLGRGPGTAGPASVYNAGHSARISENYFLQLAQETGWLGVALFSSINIFVARLLWQRRSNPLATMLLASLVGMVFVNLLSHAWTDDTIAYVWWGFAGIAIGAGAKQESVEKSAEADPARS